MQALPEDLAEGDLEGEHTLHTRRNQLPTGDVDFPDDDNTSISASHASPGALSPPDPRDVAHEHEPEDDELPEDTMRYTKSNSRVLLQEDTMASAHIATSPSLPPIQIDDPIGTAPATEHSGYDPQEHLLTEEAMSAIEQLADGGPGDLKSTAVLGSTSSPLTEEHIAAREADLDDDDDDPTMRFTREEKPSNSSQSQDALATTAPDPEDEKEKARRVEKLEARFKQVKALLGADEKPFDIYNLEEQHTLSQPIDIEVELQKRRKKQAANPHMAASFALSQTLQDLSVKEVEELKLEQARQAAKAASQKAKAAQKEEPPAPEAEADSAEKKSLPGWLVWGLGLLLWLGVGALIWKIATAPQAPTPASPRQSATTTPTPRDSAAKPSQGESTSDEPAASSKGADASTAAPDDEVNDSTPDPQ